MTISSLGEVEITLAGDKYTLRSTIQAARIVSNINGGFTGAFNALANYNMSVYVAIVAAGLGKKGSDATKIEEAVYETGLQSLTDPLVEYVTALMNGGRAPKGVGEDALSGK